MPAQTEYRDADMQDQNLLRDCVELWHHELADAGVDVGLRFAWNPDKPPIKLSGRQVPAAASIVSYSQRIDCKHDAIVLVDELLWRDSTEQQKKAMLDSALSRLKVKKTKDENKNEVVARDPLSRPKLRKVQPDIVLPDAFTDVVERHLNNSVELNALLTALRSIKTVIDNADNKLCDSGSASDCGPGPGLAEDDKDGAESVQSAVRRDEARQEAC